MAKSGLMGGLVAKAQADVKSLPSHISNTEYSSDYVVFKVANSRTFKPYSATKYLAYGWAIPYDDDTKKRLPRLGLVQLNRDKIDGKARIKSRFCEFSTKDFRNGKQRQWDLVRFELNRA